MSTRADLLAAVATDFPDNNSELITPAILRGQQNDFINSAWIPATDGTPLVQGLSSLLINGGLGAAATVLQIVETGSSSPRGVTNDQYNNGNDSPQLNWRKARGTLGSPLTIVTGDGLLRIVAWGHDGTGFIQSGNIQFSSNGTIGTNRVPSQFVVSTSTDASPSVLTVRLTINNAGLALFTGPVQTSDATASTTTTTGCGIFAGGIGVAGSIVCGGLMIAANGSATNPSITFASSSTTGFFRSGATIGFAAGGVGAGTFSTQDGAGGIQLTALGTNKSIVLIPNGSGTVQATTGYVSSTPSGGTAGTWKFGIRVAATVVLDTTQYIQLDVGGTLYKVAIAS